MNKELLEKLYSHQDAYETELKMKGFSEQTRRAYLSRLRGFLTYLGQYASSTEQDDLRALRRLAQAFHCFLSEKKGAKPSSVNAAITAVYNYYAFLGYSVSPVIRDWIFEIEPKLLSHEELMRLMDAIATESSVRDKALVSLLLFSGIRIGECRKIKLADLEMASEFTRLKVCSGGRCRVIELNSRLKQCLQDWLQELRQRFTCTGEQSLFPNKNGVEMTRAGMDEAVRKLGRKAGLNLSAQTLRNTCLSKLLESGGSVDRVAAIGGQVKPGQIRRFRRNPWTGLPADRDGELYQAFSYPQSQNSSISN